MGFYFRKSKSFGLFRINLSKSGLGLSTGVKGARLSFGPRGTYVNLGSKGMYYRKKLGSNSRKNNGSKYSTTQYQQADNSIPEINITSESMVKNDFENQFITDIKNARTLNTIWTIFFIVSVIMIPFFPLASIISVVGIISRIIFRKHFNAIIEFDLDENSKSAWDNFLDSLSLTKSSKKLWVVESTESVYDTKKNAGVGRNVKRRIINSIKVIKPQSNNPFKIKTNSKIFFLDASKCKIAFIPNMLLVLHSGKITGYSYDNLYIETSTIRFIESSQTVVPKDAQIINWTWQYVNKNGGPDRRYSNNPKLPICQYGNLKLKSPNGLGLEFQFSNVNAIGSIKNDFTKYISYIDCLENVKAENEFNNATSSSSNEKVIESKLQSNNQLINELAIYLSIKEDVNE